MIENRCQHPFPEGRPESHGLLDRFAPAPDKMKADVPASRTVPSLSGRRNDLIRDNQFVLSRSAAQALDHLPISIFSSEILKRVHTRRILVQYPLDVGIPLEERGPIQRRKQPETRDTVADRHLVRCLPLVLTL